jgi:hypothetical protein
MKVILLVEGESSECSEFSKDLEDNISDGKIINYIDTNYQTEIPEEDYLENVISNFSNSRYADVLVIRYSGNESLAEDISGRFSDMIVSVSYDKDSKYYIDNPKNVFREFVNTVS